MNATRTDEWGRAVSAGGRTYVMLDPPTVMLACSQCGAFVADRNLHDRAHDLDGSELVVGPDDRLIVTMDDANATEVQQLRTVLERQGLLNRTTILVGGGMNLAVARPDGQAS